MSRRFVPLLALLLAAVAGMGAAHAPGDPPSMYMYSLEPSGIGRTTWLSVQVRDLTADTQPELGAAAVVTLPAGFTFVSAGEPGDNGACTAAGAVVTCTVDRFDQSPDSLMWRVTVQVSDDLTPGDRLTTTAAFGDLTTSYTTTVVLPVDLGVTVVTPPALPIIAGKPFTYSVVVHNYGPGTIDKIAVRESFGGRWFGGGATINGGISCPADPGYQICELTRTLRPGEEVRIDHTMPTRANADTWGARETGAISVYDEPTEIPNNEANNSAGFPIVFAAKPAGTATPSPSTTTAAPGGGTGGDNNAGGGLPITGSATLPLVGGGLALLLTGAGVLLLTRRRTRTSA